VLWHHLLIVTLLLYLITHKLGVVSLLTSSESTVEAYLWHSAQVGLRSLRKNRKLTVITAFVPYRNRFLTVNLQYHVLMTNRLKKFSIVPMAINIPILFILGVVLYQQSCLQSKTLLLTFTSLSALVLIMRNTLY
jgi:hypothetical protein